MKLFFGKNKKSLDLKDKNIESSDIDNLEQDVPVSSDEKLRNDGELTVDIYQTDSDLIIQSAVAGVDLKDLDISIDKDLILIKGKRDRPSRDKGDYFYKECYWGSFSRKIILPVEVNNDKVKATLKKGILTIKIAKKIKGNERRIVIQG